jgi:drug/metabolite transporter (DMT)-like permease
VLWSTAGAAIKLSSLDAWQLSGGRSLVAALTLLCLVPAARHWPSRRGWLVALAYAATVTLFVVANRLTTAANAIFLQDTAPLHVLLLSPWLLGERPTRGELLAVPAFFAGLSLFFLDQLAPGQALGNAIALTSGVAFALCIIGLRKVQGEGATVLAAGNAIAAVVAAPLALGGSLGGPADLGIVLFLGVFQLALAYLLMSRGLREATAIEASLLLLLEPVLSPVWTFLVAHERPGRWALAGGAVILVAIAWRTVAARAAAPDAPGGEDIRRSSS